MDKKLQDIVDGLDEKQAERLRLLDAIRAALQVQMLGVDITSRRRLPPELSPPTGDGQRKKDV